MAAAAWRRVLAPAALATLLLAGCSSPPPKAPDVPDWTDRLQGSQVVLLGEVHDNREGHQRRLLALQAALKAGWRPAIVMEQFDREHQVQIDLARREQPRDVDHLIARATQTPPGKPPAGWDWALYRPLLALVLQHRLPLLAGNLSTTQARQVVREGYAAVFRPDELQALGLDQPTPADLLAGQSREIDLGHCGALPPAMLPAMVRAQLARDAVMARVLQAHAERGVVLVAGNGHVRRDLGVPRWLPPRLLGRTVSVGFLELTADGPPASPASVGFDQVELVPAARRPDPCAAFRAPPAAARPAPATRP